MRSPLVVSSLLSVVLALFVASCGSAPRTSAEPFDVLLVGGTVYDGSDGRPVQADVGIRGDEIVAIGDLAEHETDRRIDAKGKIVCPGFIDLHNHSDRPMLQAKLRYNLAYLTQGCTTIVTGNCGSGKIDVDPFFGRMKAKGIGTNVAHLLPQGSIRRRAMGGSFDRAPSAEEMQRMRKLVDKGMRAGAFGMTTGLIYTPGSFAKTDEIVGLAEIVAKHGGIYASHIRDEGDALLEAVEEAIAIGRRAGCPVHLSHFKASKPPNWGKVKQSCALVEKARADGLAVTCDQYPYRASSTSLAALVIPVWAREGKHADLVARLADSESGPRIRTAIKRAFEERGGYDKILIAQYAKNPAWNGKTVEAAAADAGMDPVELVCAMHEHGRVAAVAFSMCDEDVEFIMRKPYVATASDGSSKMPDATRPHPRSYGTFPRKLGHYVRRGVVPLGHAIRSSTGLPAQILGLRDRGFLRKGMKADVVVFDPDQLEDKATFVEPHRFSVGIEWVFVNGVAAIAEGKPTRALAGLPLRRRP